MGVEPGDVEGGVGIAGPATAVVQRLVDAAEAVLAGQTKGHAVVLAVGNVLEASDRTQGLHVEGPRCPQTVDSQGIVVAVGVGPLAVVNDSGWNRAQVEIGHRIAADNHGAPLPAEHVHNPLQCIRSAVHVVAVKLHRIAAAERVVDAQIPAATDTQGAVRPRNNVNHTAVLRGHGLYPFGSAICGAVVYNEYIEGEIRPLRESRAECVPNRGGTVEHRNNHRHLRDRHSSIAHTGRYSAQAIHGSAGIIT